jgi:hypothetical protein
LLLFLDESGTDHRVMPYEVNGGIALREQQLWSFVQDVAATQELCFGGALKDLAPEHEFKGKNLLAADKFRFARQGPAMSIAQRQELARAFLQRRVTDAAPRKAEFTAYGQACLAYVEELLALCGAYGVRVFASMVGQDAPASANPAALRRDLAFLFERYAYYIEDLRAAPVSPEPDAVGLLVFDELERAQCRRLLDRMESYFVRTENGRQRSQVIIPEPFFVHSDLTTGTQVADIIIYILNWAYRYGPMTGPTREELGGYCRQIQDLVYRTTREDTQGKPWTVWSVKYVDDLRGRDEREP